MEIKKKLENNKTINATTKNNVFLEKQLFSFKTESVKRIFLTAINIFTNRIEI